MNNKDIQDMLTVAEWGMWLRYIKKNNVKNIGGLWTDYDFHEFYTSLDIKETEGEMPLENISKGRSDSKGGQSLVPSNVPEGHGIGDEMGLHAYDHIPQRRNPYEVELPLSEPSNGPKNVGPSTEPSSGV